MKQINILVFATLILTTLSAAAQPSIGFEVGAGLRLSVLSKEQNDFFDSKGRLAFSFGATALVPLGGQRLVLQPTVRYIQKGSKLVVEKNLDFPSGSYFTDNLNYLEINPLLQWRFSEEGRGFYLLGGPMLGVGLSGKYNYNIRDVEKETGNLDFGTGENDDRRLIDVGVILGIGYFKYNEDTNRTFFVSLQSGLGLTDLGTDYNILDEKNLNFMFNFGYTFPLFSH